LVEHQLPKLRVASSNLVSRSDKANDSQALREAPELIESHGGTEREPQDPGGIPQVDVNRPRIVRELLELGGSVIALSLGWDLIERSAARDEADEGDGSGDQEDREGD
jgi:hypothetical protein